MTTEAQKPLRIFCSYSRRDEEHLNDLRGWLRGLERRGLIQWWHDREIVPGWEWEEAIDKNLRTADVILLLVSPDFMASDYVYENEISRAVERHQRGEARVIPIIVRPSDWEDAPFYKIQAVPKDARPITRWPDRDEAWLDVLRGVRRAVEELLVERQERSAKERYRKVVGEAWADDKVSNAEAERLSALASELSLSIDTAADIEHEVMGDTKEAILARQEQAAREKVRKERLDELYARARKLHRAHVWQSVVDVFQQIHAEEPDYSDPQGLLESARGALRTQNGLRATGSDDYQEYEGFQRLRKNLVSLIERQIEVLQSLHLTSWIETLNQLTNHLLQDNFEVLVLGEFKVGKSTLINALLGAEVLPAYPTPTTAIVAEVKWGEAPKAVLHFRVSENSDTPPPKEIPIERLEDQLAIRDLFNKEQEIRESPYSKVEVFWPLELCRNGVEFIDTPGLNEHQLRDKVTLDYLVAAVDAVLFVMSAERIGPSRSEAVAIKTLLAAGHRSIFFVVNRINQLPVRERERVIQYGLRQLGRLTEMGEEGVFFIDSWDALESRLNDDSVLMHQSGILAIEAVLKDFLTTQRARTKILTPAYKLKASIREVESVLAEKGKDQARSEEHLENLAAAAKRINGINNELDDLLGQAATS